MEAPFVTIPTNLSRMFSLLLLFKSLMKKIASFTSIAASFIMPKTPSIGSDSSLASEIAFATSSTFSLISPACSFASIPVFRDSLSSSLSRDSLRLVNSSFIFPKNPSAFSWYPGLSSNKRTRRISCSIGLSFLIVRNRSIRLFFFASFGSFSISSFLFSTEVSSSLYSRFAVSILDIADS